MNYRILILIILLLDYGYTLFKRKLNKQQLKKPLPKYVSDIYNEEEYQKFMNYNEDKAKFSFLNKTISLVLNLVVILSPILSLLISFLPQDLFLGTLLFIVILNLITLPIEISFNYYFDFKIEAKYGFNKMTLKTFILDQIKDLVTSFILLSVLLFIGIKIYEFFGNLAFIFIFIGIILFVLLINLFSLQILKIYNTFTPMEDSSLKDRLTSLALSYGFKIKNIFVMDASSRTSHANAFCTGLGKYKSISLDDNLIQNFSEDEIVAVFAHELAHAYYKDSFKQLFRTILNLFVYVLLFMFISSLEGLALDFNISSFHLGFTLMMFFYLIDPILEVTECIFSLFSRKQEYRADTFATNKGYGKDLINALKKLSKGSLVNLNPHPFIIMTSYSHPTLNQRIENIIKNDPSIEESL